MASPRPRLFLSFLLIISAAISAAIATANLAEKTTHLHFYFHEVFEGAPNATTFTVAGLGRRNSSAAGFGNILVYDVPLREGPESSSRLIGRAQGMNVVASLEDGSLLTTQNYVFTAGEYNGSTIALFGRADTTATAAERTIVGGSGAFRLARGYGITKVIEMNTSRALFDMDFYVMHY